MPVPVSIPVVPEILGPPHGNPSQYKYLVVNEVSRVTGSLVLHVQRTQDSVQFIAKMVFFDTSPTTSNTTDANGQQQQNYSVALQRVEREIRCLSRCSHFACVALVDSFIVPNEKIVILIMELCTAGSLSEQMNHYRESGRRFREFDIVTWFLFLTMGLHHIHRANMLHRDLKPPNILLHVNGLLKIADFGLSNVYEETVTSSNVGQTICGTPNYLAPELWSRQPYSAKADLYSLGVVVYELIEFTTPYASMSIDELHRRVMQMNPRLMTNLGGYAPYQSLASIAAAEAAPPVCNGASLHLQHLILRLLEKAPENRPTTLDLLASPLLLTHCVQLLQMFHDKEEVFGSLQTDIVVRALIDSLKEVRQACAANPQMLQNHQHYPPSMAIPGFHSHEQFFQETFQFLETHFFVDKSVSYRGYVGKFRQEGQFFERRYMILENGELIVRRAPPKTKTASNNSTAATEPLATSFNESVTSDGGRSVPTSDETSSTAAQESTPTPTTTATPKGLPLEQVLSASLYGMASAAASPTTASSSSSSTATGGDGVSSNSNHSGGIVGTSVFCFLTVDGVSTFFQADTPADAYNWVFNIQKAKRKRCFV